MLYTFYRKGMMIYGAGSVQYEVGTFGTESAVQLHSGRGNLPYLNAKPRQIPLLVMQRMNSNAESVNVLLFIVCRYGVIERLPGRA